MDKIMIVDDDFTAFRIIKKILEDEDYEFYYAANGKEALNLLKKITPVSIITDLNMPIMGGIEFLKKLHLTGTEPYSVIVVTIDESSEDIKSCFELGISNFIAKPFNRYLLKSIINNSVNMKKLEKEKEKLYLELIKAKELEVFKAMTITTNHEIKQPLSIISVAIQYIEMIHKKSPKEDFSKFIQDIKGAVDRITEILGKMNKLPGPKYSIYTKDYKMVDIHSNNEDIPEDEDK